jgi:molybdate transport system substrate-binding protein
MYRILISVLAAVVLLGGCSKKKPEQREAAANELLLYCGAGIRPPVDKLVHDFENESGTKIAVDYAGSEVLLSKIKLTHKGDLYLPGDSHYVAQAAKADMILSQEVVCYFVPTILVQKGNPKNIQKLEDLLKPGVKLGLGDAKACAIGLISREIFDKNNISGAEVEKNLKFQSQTVNELGLQIQAQALDAVIVWDAIAHYYDRYGTEVSIPLERNVISTVDIGVLKFTRNKEAAEKFVQFITSQKGRDVFKEHNYTVDTPK